MISRKYVKDYKFLERLDSRGRLKTTAVYTGTYYRFRNAPSARAMGRLLFPAMLIAWLLFVGAMIPNSRASHTMYVILPFAFTALPLGFLTKCLWLMKREKEPFIRSVGERFSQQLPGWSLAGTLLCSVSFLGELITVLIVKSFSLQDAIFLGGCLLLLLLMLYTYCIRKRAAVVET